MKIQFKPIQPDAFRKYTQWAILVTALAMLLTASALSARESVPADAVYTDIHVSSSVNYSSNEMASQGNEPSDAANSRNFKNSAAYTIRTYENTVAIFEGDNPVPVYTIDTPLNRLPAADRTLLAAGIEAETLAEAYKLIEDYE